MSEYNLLIAAQPTVPLILMVTEGEYAAQVDSRKCFYPAMIDRVRELIDEYHIRNITVYGPRTYIAHIGDEISKTFADTNVKLAFAGEEC